METAKYYAVERWGWGCPKCDHWNEQDDDPSYQEVLICEECQSEFEPEQA